MAADDVTRRQMMAASLPIAAAGLAGTAALAASTEPDPAVLAWGAWVITRDAADRAIFARDLAAYRDDDAAQLAADEENERLQDIETEAQVRMRSTAATTLNGVVAKLDAFLAANLSTSEQPLWGNHGWDDVVSVLASLKGLGATLEPTIFRRHADYEAFWKEEGAALDARDAAQGLGHGVQAEDPLDALRVRAAKAIAAMPEREQAHLVGRLEVIAGLSHKGRNDEPGGLAYALLFMTACPSWPEWRGPAPERNRETEAELIRRYIRDLLEQVPMGEAVRLIRERARSLEPLRYLTTADARPLLRFTITKPEVRGLINMVKKEAANVRA